jgi:hypothetical protein
MRASRTTRHARCTARDTLHVVVRSEQGGNERHDIAPSAEWLAVACECVVPIPPTTDVTSYRGAVLRAGGEEEPGCGGGNGGDFYI